MIKQKYEQLKTWIRRNTHKILIRWCIRYLKRFYKVGYEYFPESRHHVWRWTDDFEKAIGVNNLLKSQEELFRQMGKSTIDYKENNRVWKKLNDRYN